MKSYLLYIILFLNTFCITPLIAQLNIFAELIGNPVVTTGWNLANSATISNDEIVLTPNLNNKSGTIFYATPIDFSNGGKFIVDFEFRMYDGSAADGIALNVLTQLPANAEGGGGIGVDPNATGLKIIFDTYDNCSTYDNPDIQVFNGTGYVECNVPTSNVVTNQSYLRSSTYQNARFIYDNGTVKVYVNCDLKITVPNVTIQNIGYFGFSAATGGQRDRHSIKNVTIYTSSNLVSTNIQNICSGEEKLIGSESAPNIDYIWSALSSSDNISLLDDPNIANPTFSMENDSDTIALQNYVLASCFNTNSCPDTIRDTIKLKIYPKPIIDSIDIEHITDCNSPLSGKATANVSEATGSQLQYQWIDKSTNQYIGGLSNIHSLSAGKYIFIVNSEGCTEEQEIEVLYPEAPKLIISADKNPICRGDSAIITATVNSGTSPFFYQWLGNNVDTNPNFTVSPNQNTTYSVIVHDSKSCKDTATINVTVNERPNADFSDDKITGCLPLTAELVNLSTGDIDSCKWFFDNHSVTENITSNLSNNINYDFSTDGCFDITLVAYSSNGCMGSITKQEIVCPVACEIQEPNVLSLSSTKGNNFWFVENIGYKEFHCEIVNRWGQIVYEYSNIDEKWTGLNKNGNALPEGIYFYKIIAKLNNESQIKQGTITLIY